MDNLNFDFKQTRISQSKYVQYEKKLEGELKALNGATKKSYDDVRSSINLPFDETILKDVKKLSNKLKDADTIVVIGIGGSNLGTIAIYEALKGKLYNQTNKKKVYFADTVDVFSIKQISDLVKEDLKQGKKVVLNAISKSGGTTETIANFEFLLDIVKKNATYNYKDYIVITTGVNSKFETYAKLNQFNILNLPDKVGGRYSVFSHVGIFPLTFLGINCDKLFEGAKEIRKICLSKSIDKNPAMKSAATIFEQNKQDKDNKNIFNTFLFSTQLESIGKWYRQLLGESIGKEFDLKGNKINSGICPTTAIGSTDLHSMAQLYLGGPNNTLHCFVDIKNKLNLKLGNDKEIDKIVGSIQSKPISQIMVSILKGTQGAFEKKRIPFYIIELDELNEFNVGAFLQMKMIEMMFLGALTNVNPFDQPNVEEYKILTKKILTKKILGNEKGSQ